MKVAFLIQSLQFAGSEKVAIELIGQYRRRRIECQLIALLPSPDECGRSQLLEAMRSLQVETVELNKRPGGSRWRSLRELHRALESFGPDIVHAHGTMPNMLAGIRNAIFRRMPTVITLHGGTDDWSTFKSRMLERAGLLGANRIVSVADHVAEAYAKKFPKAGSRMTVIENGIDGESFPVIGERERADIRRQWDVGEGDKLLLQVARLDSNKNQRFLIEVAAALRARRFPFKMLLVGPPGDAEYAKGLAELLRTHGLEDRVLLPGSRKDVPALLQASDLFLFPSRMEASPLAMLEAMYAGLPVICSDIAAHRKMESYGDNHCLPPEVSAWADRIESVASRQDGARRRPEFPGHLTLSRVSDAYMEVYRQAKLGRGSIRWPDAKPLVQQDER